MGKQKVRSSVVLGIDAGGTYTDAVLYDSRSERVVSKNKALTTKDDLTRGISEAIDGLDRRRFGRVSCVAMSTTFATNALAEERGGTVALMVLPCPGFDREMIAHEPMAVLNGRTGIKGDILEDLDVTATQRVVSSFLDDSVEAFAVSGYASVRNPEHEIRVKSIIRDICKLPVVCGHELVSSLDFTKRANTAVWNARLLPLVHELIASVKRTLLERNIAAPLMIVKGDGTLMSEELALERPIETVLSGPAASVIGAQKLSGLQTATIVDMGGTTTDIAKIASGRPLVNEEGALVGRWRTSVNAADIQTTGLGGDSHVWLDDCLELQVGPRRVVPLSLLGRDAANVIQTLRAMIADFEGHHDPVPPEFLVYVREGTAGLLPDERRILEMLRGSPWPRHRLASALGKVHWKFLDTERLESQGRIQVASVTPTDALHALGRLSLWNAEAAGLGVRLLALHKGIEADEMAEQIVRLVQRRLALEILRKQLNHASAEHGLPGCRVCEELLDTLFDPESRDYRISVALRHPVVAIGAPVHAYFPPLRSILNTEIVIPEHAEVANALGAAAANVLVEVECLVQPRIPERFLLHTPRERLEFAHLQSAIEYGREQAITIARERAKMAGAAEAKPQVDIVERNAPSRTGQVIHLDTRIRARIVAPPCYR
jgi:N-methylhydantoinase A/oxoprolinase/acetone carboxylase beta subunit